jgi:hypothetical protein
MIRNLFGKSQQIFDFQLGSVIKDDKTRVLSEYLMAKIFNDNEIEIIHPIDDRLQRQFEPMIIGCELPRFQIIIGIQ